MVSSAINNKFDKWSGSLIITEERHNNPSPLDEENVSP